MTYEKQILILVHLNKNISLKTVFSTRVTKVEVLVYHFKIVYLTSSVPIVVAVGKTGETTKY